MLTLAGRPVPNGERLSRHRPLDCPAQLFLATDGLDAVDRDRPAD